MRVSFAHGIRLQSFGTENPMLAGRDGELPSGMGRVNGTVQTTGIAFPTYAPSGQKGTQTVPDKTVYILGDYRTDTQDSRNFGPVPLSDVKAKVIAVLRHKVL